MHIRVATAEDAGAIATVHVDSWRGAYRGLIPDTHLDGLSVERRREDWRRSLARSDFPRAGTVVLQEGSAVIGFVAFRPSRDDDAPANVGEVTSVYVTPSSWGRGGGLMLIDAAQSFLKAAAFEAATLWVLEGNARARLFYERQGSVPDGAHKLDDRGAFVLAEVRYTTVLRAPRAKM